MATESALPTCCSVVETALDEPAAVALATVFKALADPARLRLLSLVAAAGDAEVCACDLTAPIGRSQPTVSHHMAILVDAGLVTREKRGRWAWYRVDRARLDEVRATLGS